MEQIRKSIKDFGDVLRNFSYTLTYQVLAIILPIITVPYVTRVLAQDLVGLNSVIQANASYFSLIGMLGIALLGPREIAKCLGDKEQLSKKFFSIYKIQFLTHVIMIIIYIGYVYIWVRNILGYFYIVYLLASMFDISWLFIGIEDFKKVAIRNVFIKVISVILLFLCVKNDDDILIYVGTLYIPTIIINLYMWCVALKKVVLIDIPKGVDSELCKEAVSLLLPQIASSVYTMLDKTVLGIFSTYEIVAVYTQGQALLRLLYAVTASFCRVMSPRISACIQQKDKAAIYKYMRMSTQVVCAVTWLLFFGLFFCAKIFVAWYLPSEYIKTGEVLILCSPIIIMVSGANLISMEFLIPLGRERDYTISIFVAAFVNLILNFLLVPFCGLYGVCIGSVVAETIGTIIQFVFAKKQIDLKYLFKGGYLYIVSGLLMGGVLIILQKEMLPTTKNIVILALVGGVMYTLTVMCGMKIRKLWIRKNK